MIIEVPYLYSVRALMGKNRRKTETFRVHGSVPVKIEEPRDEILAGSIPVTAGGEVTRGDLMHWDGSFWVNVVADLPAGDKRVSFLDAGTLAARVAEASDNSYDIRLSVLDRYDAQHAKANLADVGARVITLSDEAAKVADIEARAASLAIFGGMVFRRVSEPVYVVSMRDDEVCKVEFLDDVQPIPGETVQGKRRYYDKIWRADRFDALLADLGWPRTLEPAQRAQAESMRMHIHHPELLSWDRERQVCLDRCQRMVAGATGLAAASKDMLCDFADARDALAGLREPGFDMGPLVEAVERLAGRCRVEDARGNVFNSYLVDAVERAVEDWREAGDPHLDQAALAGADFAP